MQFVLSGCFYLMYIIPCGPRLFMIINAYFLSSENLFQTGGSESSQKHDMGRSQTIRTNPFHFHHVIMHHLYPWRHIIFIAIHQKCILLLGNRLTKYKIKMINFDKTYVVFPLFSSLEISAKILKFPDWKSFAHFPRFRVSPVPVGNLPLSI